METTNTLEVANTIKGQIGNRALFMLGAKNFLGSENALTFKISGSPKRVSHIRVTLEPMDTYLVEFIRCHGTKLPVTLASRDGVHADSLVSVIENETALRTSL